MRISINWSKNPLLMLFLALFLVLEVVVILWGKWTFDSLIKVNNEINKVNNYNFFTNHDLNPSPCPVISNASVSVQASRSDDPQQGETEFQNPYSAPSVPKYVIGPGLQKGVDAYSFGNYVTALTIFTSLADENNDPLAQSFLGVMHAKGEGVSQNYAKAAEWYSRAANAGIADAQANLGAMYARGEGVEQDYDKAIHWTRLAAEAGHARAQNNLGVMYAIGEGDIKPDNRLAYLWFSLAAGQGFDEAKENRVRVEKDMSPEQISEAQDMAKECLENKYLHCQRPAPVPVP